MSKVKIEGHGTGTGTFTVTTPSSNTDRTITLPDSTGTLATTADVPSSITDNGDATAITINSSENVGIGVVPEVTHSTHDALQVGGNGVWTSYSTQGASGEMDFQHNAYFAASGNDQYISTDEATKYRQGGGTHRFYTAPSGSADAAITWTQRTRIDSDGLKFNNDSAAANALDDYEEGTWQPSYTTSSGSITAHPTYSLCRYTKIGRVVQIQGLVSTSAVSSPSGSVKMYGLPFTVDNNTSGEDSGAAAIAVANIVDFASSLHMLTINPQTGGTYLNFTEFNGTSTNSNIANRWQQDTYFRFSGTYTTN